MASLTAVNSGGVVWVNGTLGATRISAFGTVSLSIGAINASSITFVGAGGKLEWGEQGVLGGTLAGFAIGDQIDLAALTFTGHATVAQSGTVLTVTQGTTVDQFHFASASNFGGAQWHLAFDGVRGTEITLVASA